MKHFFWDQRATTLEDQVLTPIQYPVEMRMTLENLTNKLALIGYYSNLFSNAFGNTNITSSRISLALSQFVRSIISYQSKYDIGRANLNNNANRNTLATTAFNNFTSQENRGKEIFFSSDLGNCVACHLVDTFSLDQPHNIGLDINNNEDRGVGEVNGHEMLTGAFKSPSLRNIELTASYMHDGRFNTLEEVIGFYDTNIQNNPRLSRLLKESDDPNALPKKLNLDSSDEAALVAFLKTLTDNTIANNPLFTDSFSSSEP